GASHDAGSALKSGELLGAMQAWGVLYPVLAAALGLLVAIATWAPAHRGRPVHALSLPLPRGRYVLLRFAAGLVLLVPPVFIAFEALLRRGRRDPRHLRVGDALDFWRVEAITPGSLLRLRAEMKLPGLAWLEMAVGRDHDGMTTYSQRAIFQPRGLVGHAVPWFLPTMR
ncbi:DUF2867 domain-containing protein, partial [Lacticaseibacillus rhamnosus]